MQKSKPSRIALVLFAMFHGPLPLVAQAAVPKGSAAEILSVQGAGEQRAAATADWQTARPAQALGNGAFVRTREASKMALLFADETQVRLSQNSVLQIKNVASNASAAQGETTLLLSLGRAWSQTKRAPDARLNMQTPAATAAIRGTDWELDVDASGKTLLTVLSGSVEFANEQGRVTVGRNEAAIAEVGKAPVKLQITNPRDRVQWVNALTADPLRHVAAADLPAPLKPAREALKRGDLAAADAALTTAAASRPWTPLLAAARQVLAGDLAGARQALISATAADGAPAAGYLMLSDLDLIAGDYPAAIATLEAGLKRLPDQPELLAQLARAQLLADRLDDSARTLARAKNADNATLLIARGELARRQGDAPATLDAFARATRAAATDDRAWYALGSAQNEREDSGPARDSLVRALQLNPAGPGYRGELGTLETFANRLADADRAFAQALQDNPADYVALTGLGLLRLKQGRAEDALDAFLRAGVLEPRYARAKTYTAVAYYRLGRHQDAISTLRQASELDDKDPVPYMFLSQIYTDLFRAGEAIAASRAAVTRLPYLKSLNQLANDQKGSANLGASLAFFGLEDWALELAQQSYYPYWGGSHLFLADRYVGEFNKNSELFQGFLSDPLAFGAGNRYSSLLQTSGHYGAVDASFDKSGYRLSAPAATVNGLVNGGVPVAYFAQGQRAVASHFPIDVGVVGVPAFADPSGGADVRAQVATLGLGAMLTERVGLFAYGNEFKVKLRGRNRVDLFGDDPISTTIDNTVRQSALGLSFRASPTSQTWAKVGHSEEYTLLAGAPALFVQDASAGVLGLFAAPAKKFEDFQLRHTMDLAAGTRASLGVEHVRETQDSEVAGAGTLFNAATYPAAADVLLFSGSNHITRRFTALTAALQRQISPSVQLDGTVAVNELRERIRGDNAAVLLIDGATDVNSVKVDDRRHTVTPRLGLVFRPDERMSFRVAYQDWLRPLSVSTLNSVETAGIPIEDRLLEAGGRLKRGVAQWSWGVAEDSFVSLKADYQRVRNPGTLGVDLRTPSLPFLEALRNTQLFNLSSTDLLEATPEFERGTVRAFTAGASRLFTANLSGYVKYLYQDSDSEYQNDGRWVTGKRIPFLPRDTFVLGTTFAHPSRLYLSGRLVYRSSRFEDKENFTFLPARWSADLIAQWESQDKHWGLGLALFNVGGKRIERQPERYLVNAQYRF